MHGGNESAVFANGEKLFVIKLQGCNFITPLLQIFTAIKLMKKIVMKKMMMMSVDLL